jgi:polygalacturonase
MQEIVLDREHARDCTAPLQAAVDRLAASGGGRVRIPQGEWHSAAVWLHSGVELYLDDGTHLLAIVDPDRYPEDSRSGRRAALVNAADAQSIALRGSGTIDGIGNSKRWEPDVDPTEFRFSLLRFVECRSVEIDGLGLYWSRLWTVHLLRCEDVYIHDCTVVARRDRINADGIDPDDCRNVRVSRCRVSTGDDAIVIKSTSGGISRNIRISDCLLESSCAAIKVGTESTGAIEDVEFSDCTVRQQSRTRYIPQGRRQIPRDSCAPLQY